jgi:hypothetical protein
MLTYIIQDLYALEPTMPQETSPMLASAATVVVAEEGADAGDESLDFRS